MSVTGISNLILDANLIGSDKIRAALLAFPDTMKTQYAHWLYSVRKSYLGTRSGSRGKFRRDLAKLRRGAGAPPEFARAGNWPNNAINAFRGKVERGLAKKGQMMATTSSGAQVDLGEGRLIMGPNGKDSPFMAGLYAMDISTPQVSIKSSSNMVFPVYRNLRKRGRLVGPMHVNRKNEALKKTIDDDQTFSITKGGKTFIFDAMDRNKRGPNGGKLRRSALLFILKRDFKMPKKFDFINQFNTLKPQYINRADSMLKRAVRAIERGYLKAA
jgi:hypothetical protein